MCFTREPLCMVQMAGVILRGRSSDDVVAIIRFRLFVVLSPISCSWRRQDLSVIGQLASECSRGDRPSSKRFKTGLKTASELESDEWT